MRDLPAIAVLVFIGLLIGAVIHMVVFRAAVALFNKLAGGPQSAHRIAEPDSLMAFRVGLVVSSLQVLTRYVPSILRAVAPTLRTSDPLTALAIQLVTLGVLSIPWIYMVAFLTKISFRKSSLVVLCHLVVSLAVFAAVVLMASLLWTLVGLDINLF